MNNRDNPTPEDEAGICQENALKAFIVRYLFSKDKHIADALRQFYTLLRNDITTAAAPVMTQLADTTSVLQVLLSTTTPCLRASLLNVMMQHWLFSLPLFELSIPFINNDLDWVMASGQLMQRLTQEPNNRNLRALAGLLTAKLDNVTIENEEATEHIAHMRSSLAQFAGKEDALSFHNIALLVSNFSQNSNRDRIIAEQLELRLSLSEREILNNCLKNEMRYISDHSEAWSNKLIIALCLIALNRNYRAHAHALLEVFETRVASLPSNLITIEDIVRILAGIMFSECQKKVNNKDIHTLLINIIMRLLQNCPGSYKSDAVAITLECFIHDVPLFEIISENLVQHGLLNSNARYLYTLALTGSTADIHTVLSHLPGATKYECLKLCLQIACVKENISLLDLLLEPISQLPREQLQVIAKVISDICAKYHKPQVQEYLAGKFKA